MIRVPNPASVLSSPAALLVAATVTAAALGGVAYAMTRKPAPAGKKPAGQDDEDVDRPPSGVWLLDHVHELGTWKGRVYATGMQDLLGKGHSPYVWILFVPSFTQEQVKRLLELTPLEDRVADDHVEAWGDDPTLEGARRAVLARIDQSPQANPRGERERRGAGHKSRGNAVRGDFQTGGRP